MGRNSSQSEVSSGGPGRGNDSISRDEVPKLLNELENLSDEWIDHHSQQFDPFRWTELSERSLRDKAFAEAAVYLYVADRCETTTVSSSLRELVLQTANDPEYYQLMLRNPEKILKYVHPLNYARSRNALGPGATETIDSVLAEKAVWSTERVPYRLMDLWNFCEVYGYSDHDLEIESILSLSCLNNQPSIINSTLTDAYALTHNLLFYHNFGVSHPAFPGGPAPYDVESVLTGLIFRYMSEGNCDIVLELLLVGVLQQQLSTDLVRLVLSWVFERAEPLGYVPGPDMDENPTHDSGPVARSSDDTKSDDSHLEPWKEEEQEWVQNYHTNLVAATTARILKKDWGTLSGSFHEPVVDDDQMIEDILSLGDIICSLSKYDLKSAAKQIIAMIGSAAIVEYPCVFDTAIEFLQQQRTDSGEYGFWPGERTLYRKSGYDIDSFHEEMIHPITEVCIDALEAVESSRLDRGAT